MRRIGLCLFALLFSSTASTLRAENGKWANLRGTVIWDGPAPVQPKIVPGVNKDVCALDKEPLEEDYIINPKNKGLKNVFVWLRPDGAKKGDPFPVDKIHPALLKPASPTAEIDQPCCRFIPHVLAARAGQTMIIKNSAPIAHNGKWSSKENGDINPLIPAGGEYKLPKPLVFEPGEIPLQCSIHGWMKAHVRVFDHPYYAVTDADGNWEIKNAPVGKFSVFVHHPATGWLNGAAGNKGQTMEIKPGDIAIDPYKMKATN